MPDGYQRIPDVRSLPAEAGGIAVTAFARSVDRSRAMLAGYQVHMSKLIEATGTGCHLRGTRLTALGEGGTLTSPSSLR